MQKTDDNRPYVGYILVSFNNAAIIEPAIESIKRQVHVKPIILVVDNASKDKSAELAEKAGATVIRSKRNLGFAAGNNVGIERLLGDKRITYMALVNSDAIIEPTWTHELVKFAANKKNAAMLQGLTLNYFDRSLLDSTSITVAENTNAVQSSYMARHDRVLPAKKVFGVNAAACLITRRFIEAQPNQTVFDEKMFMYLEDVDIAARATVAKWDNYFVPYATAYHMGSISSNKKPGMSMFLTYRNNTGMIVKSFPGTMLAGMIRRGLKADAHRAGYFIKRRNYTGAWLIVKGRLASIGHLPYYLSRRRALRHERTIDPTYLRTLMR